MAASQAERKKSELTAWNTRPQRSGEYQIGDV